jgi:hypothetical protein
MKFIKMLPDVELKTMSGELVKDEDDNVATASMKDLLYGRLTDPKCAGSMDAIIKAVKMKELIDDADEYLVLDDAYWALLSDVVKNPSPQAAYNPVIAHCLLGFMEAVTEPLDKLPKVEEPESEDAKPKDKTAN